jgi:ribulose-5-phosphate 4-epimerase/fuculose-1-phosphate aldolase
MTDIEKVLREKLAASHHLIHIIGCDDLLATHLSARIPGTNHLLITPHNVPFEEVCASNLVKADFDGNSIGYNKCGLMPQAINIHSSIYKAEPNIMGAVHTHSVYGNAVAALECGLLFINQHSLRFYNDVAYHELDGLALGNEGEEIVKSLKTKKVMVLRNHGLLTVGNSIEEALYRMYYLERLCEIQIKTLSAGMPIHSIPEDICLKTKAQYDSILTPHIEFEVFLRRIEGYSKVDYRD